MKELKSTFKIKIPNQSNFKNSIQKAFEGYKLEYKKFSDIYEIKNKDFKHSIWYNEDKDSKIKTQRRKEPKELFFVNIGMLVLLVLSFYLNRKFGWFEDHMTFFWIYLVLISPVN